MYININLIKILIIFQINSFFVDCKDYSCKDIANKSIEMQLKNHLLCDYNPYERKESKGSNKTMCKINLNPHFMQFDDSTNTIDVHLWAKLMWDDDRLKWNPKDYGGFDMIKISSTELWVPDLTIHNLGKTSGENIEGIPKTNCFVYSDGVVLCIPNVNYVAHCNSDYINYPYDIHNCTLDVAPWTYTSDEIGFKRYNIFKIDLTDFKIDANIWRLLTYYDAFVEEKFKMNPQYNTSVYKFAFLFQRVSHSRVIYIAPAFALMVLSLSVLWLDCHSTERIILVFINFISHLLCLHNLFVDVPFNGDNVPKILRLYESSFVVMTLTVIVTVLLRELWRLSNEPPEWLNSIAIFVLQSKVGQFLLLSVLDPKASAFLESTADDNDDLVEIKKKKESKWNYIVLILGWIIFIAVLLTYLVLFIMYMPSDKKDLYKKRK